MKKVFIIFCLQNLLACCKNNINEVHSKNTHSSIFSALKNIHASLIVDLMLEWFMRTHCFIIEYKKCFVVENMSAPCENSKNKI